MQMQATLLMQLMDKFFLEQLITEDTRKNNILDLLLTNNIEAINNIEINDTSLSDHRLIMIQTSIS